MRRVFIEKFSVYLQNTLIYKNISRNLMAWYVFIFLFQYK